MMFEKQRKMEDDRSKASSSSLDEPCCPQSDLNSPSANSKLEALKLDHVKTGFDTSSASAELEESCRSVSRKQKVPENRIGEDLDSNDNESSKAPAKRSRADETEELSSKPASD